MNTDSFGLLVRPDDLDWVETPGGNAIKVLRASAETGSYSALFRAPKGMTNPPHKHLGPADFLMLSGSMEYAGGVARAGDWIYEPNGAVHEETHHPEESVYLANVHGPLVFYGPATGDARRPVVAVSDIEMILAYQAQQTSRSA